MYVQITKSLLHLSFVQAFLNLAEKQKNKRQEIDRENLI